MKIVGKIRKSEKVCGYWRCNKRIPDNSFLCAEHYEDWDEGLINQCPVCNRFKDVMHYLCPDCFGGRSVVPWKPHVRIPPSKQQHEVEYSEARANGKSQIATRAGEGAGYSYSWMDSHLSPARCFVYILEFDDGQFYVGHTIDLRKQLAEHRKQKASSLTGRNPKLQYVELAPTSRAAELREAELKKLVVSNPHQIRLMFAEFNEHMREFGLKQDF